jgi:hypothetical protein
VVRGVVPCNRRAAACTRVRSDDIQKDRRDFTARITQILLMQLTRNSDRRKRAGKFSTVERRARSGGTEWQQWQRTGSRARQERGGAGHEFGSGDEEPVCRERTSGGTREESPTRYRMAREESRFSCMGCDLTTRTHAFQRPHGSGQGASVQSGRSSAGYIWLDCLPPAIRRDSASLRPGYAWWGLPEPGRCLGWAVAGPLVHPAAAPSPA